MSSISSPTHTTAPYSPVGREQGAAARSGGYLVAAGINVLLMWIAHHLTAWGVSFITDGWNDALWAIDLSLEASFGANLLFMVYDARWFHCLVQVAPSALATLALWWLYQIFPFELGSPAMNSLAHVALLILCVAAAIGTVATGVAGVVSLARSGVEST
jgi:hypothetical protein